VDVLVTMKDDGTGQKQRAKLFMSNMRVLSVGANIERGPDGRPLNEATAALEVTPTEAEQLAIATSMGQIQLVLRGYGDPDTVNTRGASLSDISLGRAVVVEPPPTRREEPRRSAPRPRPAPVTPAPVVIVQQAPPPVRPRSPDSSVIQVYRGPQVSQTRIEKRDTIKP
jgi:pilus assembly protein CpaB